MKKFVATSLALCMSLTPFTAYAGKNDAKNSKTESTVAETELENTEAETEFDEKGTHTVVDHAGNTVEVPNHITRVVIDQIPILSTYMSYFGGSAPYIVGYCGSFKDTITKTVLKDIAPELMESSDTVYAQSDLNIEEIMNLKPDVILYNAGNTAHAEDRIADIPEDERPSAMILWKYSDGVPQVSGKGTFGTYWLQHLGVTDVVVDEAQGFTQVDMEQVYSWNPDILFLDGPGLLSLTTEDVLENKVEGADFSTLTAVQNGRVYDTTLGMWNWFTPNPDAPLVFAWLACNTYPEAFADYPLEDTIKEYYKDWYDYEVTDEYLEEMLQY